jgi:hypothetical protein
MASHRNTKLGSLLRNVSGNDKCSPAPGKDALALKCLKLSGDSFPSRADTSCKFGVPWHWRYHAAAFVDWVGP